MEVMDKEQVLLQIRKAKTAHLRWRAYAMALSSGYAVEEGQLPMQPTECQFGCWYHNADPVLSKLPEFIAIDKPHKLVHQVYQEIFELLFNQPEPSFWQKLLGSQASSNKGHSQQIEYKIGQLSEYSRQMLEALEKLESAVSAA